MIYTVVGMKGYTGSFDKDVFLFHNQEEAYASLRRDMRNLVISGDINSDTLNETKFFSIGEFDTDTGKFDNFEKPICMNAIDMVYDLIGDSIPMIGEEDA